MGRVDAEEVAAGGGGLRKRCGSTPRGSFEYMVRAKDAIQRAREYAAELLGDMPYTVEEIEQDTYKCRTVWRITL